MDDEKGMKRYEPFGFLLVMGMISMLGVMLYTLYKFRQNLQAGILTAPDLGGRVYAGGGVLIAAFILLLLGFRLFRRQQFAAFRACLAGSFAGGVLFVVLQVISLPVEKVMADPEQQGQYYLGFLSGIHLLFVLAGVVATGVLLGRAYRRQEYVEAFIFSVNPPNILNLKLLVRYMGFVTGLWMAVIIFLGGYAV